MPKVKCLRCGQEGEGFASPPYPGPLGEKIVQGTCPKCWEEWKKFSVMVINDFKLRPFLPEDRAVLEKHMKQYLNLEGIAIQQPYVLTGQGKEVHVGATAVTREQVVDMLQQIYDPEIPVNIYDLGLIYDIAIAGEKVGIKMTLTSQFCPAAQSIPVTVKEALERLPGVREATVEIVWDPPWTREKISEEGRRILGI
jgi:FeS assembly SUF system protein